MAVAIPPKYLIRYLYMRDLTCITRKKGMLTYNTQHSFLYCSHIPWQDTIGILCQCVV